MASKTRRPTFCIVASIIEALRSHWLKFGENRKHAIKEATVVWVEGRMSIGRVCQHCGRLMRDKELHTYKNGRTCMRTPYEIHHIVPVRSAPWDKQNPDWGLFIDRLYNGRCILICKQCHDKIED